MKYAVPVLLALTMGVACNRTDGEAVAATPTAAQTPAPADGQAAPPAGAPADPDAPPAEPAKPVPDVLPEVVARVNGQPIAKTDLERAIRNLELNAGGSVPAERRAEIFRGVLDQLVGVKLLEQEAAARNIKATDAEVDQGINEMKAQAPDPAAFDKALTARQMTEADLRAEARQRLCVDKLLVAEVEPKAAVGPQDIEAFYKGNPQFFMQPEAARASHILLKAEPGSEATKQAARAKAEEVLKQVKAGGDFAALAKQHSQDGSASNGGDLGFFPRGQMVKAFEDAAFGMKAGEVSDLVESEFGFHIIKVTDHRPARTVPLAEVNDRIAVALRQQKQQELAEQFVQALKAKGKVEILI